MHIALLSHCKAEACIKQKRVILFIFIETREKMSQLNIFILLLFALECISEVSTKHGTVQNVIGCCDKTIEMFFASNDSIVSHGNMTYKREKHTADFYCRTLDSLF